ncbi:MAG: hypothetical protein ACREWG_06425 [Gammaproteobacteria bacterium]
MLIDLASVAAADGSSADVPHARGTIAPSGAKYLATSDTEREV